MKVIASTDEYTIYQRRDDRYAVKGADKQPINGDAKIAILLKHELIVAVEPKAPEPEAVEEAEDAAAEETEAAAAEEASEEAPAEEAAEEATEEPTEAAAEAAADDAEEETKE